MIAKIFPCLTPQADLNGELRGVRYFDIRKLTELECFRLMDVDEDDARKMCESPLLSKSARYKLAGNSIVVNCLYLIFKQIWNKQLDPNKQPSLFGDLEPAWNVPIPDTIRMVTLCSGYDSQALAMRRFVDEMKANGTHADFDLSAWAEYDPESKKPLDQQPAVIAHNILFPQWKERNLGDMTKIDWLAWRKEHPEEIDLLTYSTPCFVAGTLITTERGLIPIEDISIFDKVLTHTGEWKNVVTPMRRTHKGKMVYLRTMMMDSIRCTANHPFYARRMKRVGHEGKRTFLAPEWIHAEDLTQEYYLGMPINNKSELPKWEGVSFNQWGHDRKQDKAFVEDGFVWYPIREISAYEDECEVYNLEVDQDHSYVANNAIVHNCQSISQAGKREGIAKGSGTRSAVLWYTEEAIRTLHPKFLLQENVRALCNKVNLPDFEAWQKVCKDCGYDNYWTVMNAKNYGIPQNRDRVFMLSVRKDLNLPEYEFPKPFPLESEVADVLEQDADQSYYLNPQNVIKFLQANDDEKGKGIIYQYTDHKFSDEELAEIRSNALRNEGTAN